MKGATGGILDWLRCRRVAILKGGWSRERAISLKTGAAVQASFRRLGVKALAMDVRPDLPIQLKRRGIQFCFVALHGPFGEDGRLQGALDFLGVPYTGSGALSSSLAMNKALSKKVFRQSGVPTADWITVPGQLFDADRSAALAHVRSFLRRGPLFVKPVDQGSAIGISKVNSPGQISAALRECFRVSRTALIERFIKGRELTVSILGPQVLPVIEIIPEHGFYDYHSKYARGGSRHLVPAPLSPSRARQAQQVALDAFDALQCSVYGRVDLIMDANRVSVLEVNTIPGMTATSLLPDAARAAGIGFDELVLRIVAHSVRKGSRV